MIESLVYSALLIFIGVFNATVATSKYVRAGRWGWRFAFCTGALPAVLVGFVANPFFGSFIVLVALYLLINPWA